jgi:YD repeat-containing protein
MRNGQKGRALPAASAERGHTTSNSYDLLYQLRTKTLPDGASTETRSYDPAGNLLSLKHFSGYTTTYGYGNLNRLTTRTPDPSLGEPTVSFTYTPTGKRASMTDASGLTTYTYDSLDRLTTKDTPEGTLNYTYDTAGNLASMTFPRLGLKESCYSELIVNDDLIILELTNPQLRQLAITGRRAFLNEGELIHTPPRQYKNTRTWARHLHASLPALQALCWRPRLGGTGLAYMLFGDRCPPGALTVIAGPVVTCSEEPQDETDRNRRGTGRECCYFYFFASAKRCGPVFR